MQNCSQHVRVVAWECVLGKVRWDLRLCLINRRVNGKGQRMLIPSQILGRRSMMRKRKRSQKRNIQQKSTQRNIIRRILRRNSLRRNILIKSTPRSTLKRNTPKALNISLCYKHFLSCSINAPSVVTFSVAVMLKSTSATVKQLQLCVVTVVSS